MCAISRPTPPRIEASCLDSMRIAPCVRDAADLARACAVHTLDRMTTQSSRSYDVHPLPGGRWELRQEGGMHAVYDDKNGAVTAAVELARAEGRGRVRIFGPDGTVESERVMRPLSERRV
jgi:hypothetical protein